MSQAAYTQNEILSQLDACAADFTFPMLDNGYVYLADVRLSAYRTERHWALIIETLGSNFRAGGVFNSLHCYGNCLQQTPGLANKGIVPVMDDPLNDAVFDEEDRWDVRQEKGFLCVRGELIPYNASIEELLKKGIGEDTWDTNGITITELVRSLVPEYHTLLLATKEELRQRLPFDLPLMICLDEWHHPDLAEDELPSGNQTFQMIADVLVSGDPTLYQPTQPPNTHWSNWLEGGTL